MMSTSERSMFKNHFEIATRGNYPLAILIGKQHRDSLFVDSTTSPIALTCYNLISAKVSALEVAQAELLSQKGAQGGQVMTFQQMLEGMPVTLDAWKSSIKEVYSLESVHFHVLFPNGNAPFTTGKQQHRMDAVLALLKAIGTDASLATVKATIQTFYNAMLLAFNTKGTSKESTKVDSSAVEAARIDMCNVMEGDFGKLIDAYNTNPMFVSKYFDEAAMKGSLQKSFTLSLKVLETKNVWNRTFANPTTQQLQITNLANTILRIFLSATKSGLIGTIYVEVAPMTTVTKLLSNCGDNSTQTYLNVLNTDLHIAGKCRIKII